LKDVEEEQAKITKTLIRRRIRLTIFITINLAGYNVIDPRGEREKEREMFLSHRLLAEGSNSLMERPTRAPKSFV
tara:strand:- start:324 stop:548 length:225 start_codon:yes stop_codon:yes gene_type:complete